MLFPPKYKLAQRLNNANSRDKRGLCVLVANAHKLVRLTLSLLAEPVGV